MNKRGLVVAASWVCFMIGFAECADFHFRGLKSYEEPGERNLSPVHFNYPGANKLDTWLQNIRLEIKALQKFFPQFGAPKVEAPDSIDLLQDFEYRILLADEERFEKGWSRYFIEAALPIRSDELLPQDLPEHVRERMFSDDPLIKDL